MRRWLITALCIISLFVCFCLCSFTVSAAVVEGGGGGTPSNGYLYLTEYKYTDTLTSFTAVGSDIYNSDIAITYSNGPTFNSSDKDSLNYLKSYLGGQYKRWNSITIDVPEIASPLRGNLKQTVKVVCAPGGTLTWSTVSIKGVYSDNVDVVGTYSLTSVPNFSGNAYLLTFTRTASADTVLDSIVIDWEYNQTGDLSTGYDMPYFAISTIVIDNYADSKADAPIYQGPDDNAMDNYKDAESKLDGTVDDTVDGIGNSFDDTADILITEGGLGNAFLLIKQWLTDLLEFRVFYDLVMVSLTFGVMVFLINLGGTVIRHHRNRGD